MRLCIVQRAIDQPSETFLRQHAQRLPGVVAVVHRDGHGLPCIGTRRAGEAPWTERLARMGQRLAGRPSPLLAHAAYARTFRRLAADVVLAQYGPIALSVLDACLDARVPLVAHFHGYDVSRRDVVERHAAAYRRLFQHAAAVIAVSRRMGRDLVRLGCPGEKIVYNPCGVDAELFTGAAPAHAPPHFVATGRMVEKKGPHLTLAAFARVLTEVPDARLRVIGDGELLGVCRDLADAMNIGHAVSFLGVQPHERVRAEMRAARAFIQHSVTATDGDMEGTPVAVLEAGAAGLPVVSTRHAGIPDVIVHGVTGLLTEEKDVAGAARYVVKLARERSLAAELGRNAADHVRRYFSHEHSIRRLALAIEAAASHRPIDDVRAELERDLPPRDADGEDDPAITSGTAATAAPVGGR